MDSIIKQYLKQQLNTQQFEAATYTEWHSLILAWAWSWKTRTLTYKIAYLILWKNIDPANILAVTFTNKAANEMKERIIKIAEDINSKFVSKCDNISSDLKENEDFDTLIQQSLWAKKVNTLISFKISPEKISKHLRIWTFHSIFLRILKQDINRLEKWYNSNFTIYDSEDSSKLIKEIIKSSKIADKIEPKTAKSIISQWKNRWLTPQAAAYEVSNEIEEIILDVYQKYQKQLEKANALDFDDLLLLPFVLFKKEPEILEKRHKKFKHILVDEAQDTNWIQFELIKMLSYWKNYFKLSSVNPLNKSSHNSLYLSSDNLPNSSSDNFLYLSSDNLPNKSSDNSLSSSLVTFIWDDFQSIYWWRGAVMENFLNVSNRWPNIKIFKLEINYRSRPHIVEAWNAIISKNEKQYKKQIKAHRQWQDYIRLLIWDSDIDEADWIINLIKKLKENKNLKWSDFAILYRTNAQSQPFEQILIAEWIPYKIWWGFKFFERKEIKDILAYLKYILNPKDTISLKRIINTPSRKIWDTTIRKLEEYWLTHWLDLNDIIQNIDWVPVKISTTTKLNIKQFNTLIKFLQSQLKNQTPAEFIKNLIQTIKYKERLKQTEWEEKAQERLENIGQLINLASNFTEKGSEWLRKFIDEVTLMSELEQQGNEWGDFVKLMTIHASKWLEFPIVFIVWLEENVFPLSRAKLDPDELEEERRLMYVAITRAKDHLFLSYAKSRQKWWNIQYNKPSRFLEELPESLLKIYDSSWSSWKKSSKIQNIEEWDIVKHKIFWKWKVLEVWNDIAIVKFFNPAFWTRKIDINFLEKI